jgi:hypothetical protein
MGRFREAIDYSRLVRFSNTPDYSVRWRVEQDVNEKSFMVVEYGDDVYSSLEEMFEDLNSLYGTSLDPRDWEDGNPDYVMSAEGEYEGEPITVRIIYLQRISNFKSIIYR